MENLPSTAIGAINRGAAAYQDGQLEDARALFVHALHLDPGSETGWLWLATVSDDPAEQRYCLNRALEINPESVGFARLANLPPGPARPPQAILDLKQPPLPPDLAHVRGVPLPILPRTALERRLRPARSKTPAAETETAPPDAGQPARRWARWWPAALLLAVVLAALIATILVRQMRPAGASHVIAVAGPLSGLDAVTGQEELRAVELAVRNVNAAGGINGTPVEIAIYDDQSNPEVAARLAEDIVANDRVLLVIGHRRSDTSLAAAPIYEAAGLAAITPSATADRLTEGNPWYFRSVVRNHSQGALIATYSQEGLGFDRASVISAPGLYETSLATAFVEHFGQEGTIVAEWSLDADDLEGSVAAVVAEIAETDDPGIIFLAQQPEAAQQFLLALRRAGISSPVIGGEALGYEDFADRFSREPEEREQPGFFTDGLYVASPLIYDSLGGDALAFSQRYWEVFGRSPEWFGAKAYDAATLAFHALAEMNAPANRPDQPETIAEARRQVRDALASVNSLERAVSGLSGPLYFDHTNSVPQSLSFGIFDLGALMSAPVQYRAVEDPASFDLAAEEASGLVFEIDGQPFRQYRVAYVGIDLNEVTNLKPREQTFDADFFLWFRHQGDAEVEEVFFPNSTTPEERLPDPIDQSEVLGERFTMYRVHDTFTNPLNFEDYPWDRHTLSISMQNVTLSQDDVVYVVDQANLRQSQEERLRSGANADQPFSRIPNWIVESVFYSQDSATVRSSTPNPRTGAPEFEQFSTYVVEMTYGRDVRAFLVKNMLPLALLALVTYISLYFAPSIATTRITLSVTSVLTASVMLQSVATGLPDVGYTVAIEWVYYVYIALSAVLVLINVTVDRWYKAKRYVAVAQLDRLARVAYPLVIVATIAVYAVRYG